METIEELKKSIQKTEQSYLPPEGIDYTKFDKTEKIEIDYLPTKLDYPTSQKVTKPSLISSIPKQSAFVSNEIQGATGTYEILSKITVETAKALQSQTGLVINFESGKDSGEFIGNKGHFGQLRLGKEKKTGRYFGIKQITEPSKVKESLEEASLQRNLNGLPHLMPLVDAIEVQNQKGNLQLYNIMPLAALGNGKELSVYLSSIQDTRFKEALLVHVAKAILKGFQGMHGKKMAHLDFKPDNLVVDATGNILVIDFGCSQYLNEKEHIKGKNQGDTNYFSPERKASDEDFPGKTTDCYAIGLTLLELAVGTLPNKKQLHPKPILNSLFYKTLYRKAMQL